MSLVAFASQSFCYDDNDQGSKWTEDFRHVMESMNFTSHDITSLLSLMSASISNGQPLPPYLKTPKPVSRVLDVSMRAFHALISGSINSL